MASLVIMGQLASGQSVMLAVLRRDVVLVAEPKLGECDPRIARRGLRTRPGRARVNRGLRGPDDW